MTSNAGATAVDEAVADRQQQQGGSARWWAAAFVLVGVVLLGATAALGWDRPAHDDLALHANRLLELLAFLTFVLLGALLVLRRPEHPIGWLLAALGLAVLVNQVSQEYALQHVAGQGSAPGGGLVALWIADWSTIVPLVLLVEVLLLFPTGRPQSRRWAWFAGVVAAGGTLTIVWRAVTMWPRRGTALLADAPVLPAGLNVLRIALIASLPVAVVALIVRFRHAGSQQRQQLKLLLFATCGLVAAAVAAMVAGEGVASRIAEALGTICIAGVAAAMTLAVLRHRLYEIDRVVSRTVSYSLLTALLAGLYVVGVVIAGTVLEPVSSDSSLAVATSTLMVAAAFTPLRMRLQRLVDRRFNRSRYDAERAVAAFRIQLRHDLRVESLHDDLLTIVAATVQPRDASLWLRPGGQDEPAGRRRAGEALRGGSP